MNKWTLTVQPSIVQGLTVNHVTADINPIISVTVSVYKGTENREPTSIH